MGTETPALGTEDDGFPPFLLPLDPSRRGHQLRSSRGNRGFTALSSSAGIADRYRNAVVSANLHPLAEARYGHYYLNRAVPERLHAEIGRKFVRKSLGSRDLAEAPRLILDAYLDSQREFDAADARLAARAAADEITAERAQLAVARHLAVTTRPGNLNARWPTFGLTYWLEQAVQQVFGIPSGMPPMSSLDDAATRSEYVNRRLCGDSWLQTVRQQPRSKWMELADTVLVPVYESADPPIPRLPANDHAIADAWSVRLVEDNVRFHAFVEEPYRAGSKPRLRPELRFVELLGLWKEKRKPRPQSCAEAERAVLDLLDYVRNIPVGRLTSDAFMDYRDKAEKLPVAMSREDRAPPFRQRVERLSDGPGPRVSGVTVKKRVGAIQALLGFAFQERWIPENVGGGLKVERASRTARTRRSFRSDELATLFAGDLFLRPDLLLRSRTTVSDVTLYWLFVLGTTSGGRIEEVGQARVADVKIDAGIIYIDIDDATDPAEAGTEHTKSVKNDGSRRIVPVHDRAPSLGFA